MCTIVGRSAGRDRNRGDNLTFGMLAEATQSMMQPMSGALCTFALSIARCVATAPELTTSVCDTFPADDVRPFGKDTCRLGDGHQLRYRQKSLRRLDYTVHSGVQPRRGDESEAGRKRFMGLRSPLGGLHASSVNGHLKGARSTANDPSG